MGMRADPSMTFNYVPNKAGYTHAGHIPISWATEPIQGPMPRPIPGQMPGTMTFSGRYPLNAQTMQEKMIHPQPENRRGPTRGRSSLRQVQNIQSSPPKNHKNRTSLDMGFFFPEDNEPSRGKGKVGRGIHTKPFTKVSAQALQSAIVLTKSREQRGPNQDDFLNSKVGSENVAESQKQEAKKVNSQLQDEIAVANLPAPTISDEALRAAGITPKPKVRPPDHASGLLTSSSKPKGRPRKAPFPAEGIRVSESLRNSLLAAGAREMHQRPLAPAAQGTHVAKTGIPQSPDTPMTSPASKPERNQLDLKLEAEVSPTDSMSTARFSETSLRLSVAKMKQDRIAKRKQSLEIGRASSEKTSTSEMSHSTTDGPDDPKDGDYGTRTTNGRKVTSSRIAPASSGTSLTPNHNLTTPRKTSTLSVKRRSSVVASGPFEKRTRQNHELNTESDWKEGSSKNPEKGSQ